jgi:predicted dinucleotide-binding enzyme
MKIGIIGSENMGRSLGILWAEQGHEVFFGTPSNLNLEPLGSPFGCL